MTTPSTPADIIEAARKLVIEGHGIDVPGALQDRSIEMVCEAIEAERERCAAIAFGFTVSAHIAHDMRMGKFPNRSEGREAIAEMIRNPGHPYNPLNENTE